MKIVSLAATFLVSLSAATILSFTLIDQVRLRAALDSAKIMDVNDSAVLSLVGSRPSLSLFFAKQSIEIGKVYRAAIADTATYLLNNCNRPRIMVYGFASVEPFRRRASHEKEVDDRNQRLAVARGQAVQGALIESGYDRGAITVDAAIDSTSNYMSGKKQNGSLDYQLSRRVDIVVGGPLVCESYSLGGGLMPH